MAVCSVVDQICLLWACAQVLPGRMAGVSLHSAAGCVMLGLVLWVRRGGQLGSQHAHMSVGVLAVSGTMLQLQ